MTRSVLQLFTVAALLLCPYLCRTGCSEGLGAAPHAAGCCHDCEHESQPPADDSRPADPSCPDECPVDCLCKGALQVAAWELDLAPAHFAVLEGDAATAANVRRGTPAAPPTPDGRSGRIRRVHLRSLVL